MTVLADVPASSSEQSRSNTTSRKPSVFVVIVTFNGAPWIRGALDSLRLSELPCVAVVVDNASSDDTPNIVEHEYPEAILIRRSVNEGFGIGNNVGISLALARGADYVFLLNQDAFTTPAAIGTLVDFLERHPEYAVATPLHCSPDLHSLDPTTQRAYLQPYAPGYLSDACLGQLKEYYDIRGINAAAWMVRSEVFRIVGGFDPIFFMYGEDDDLITRLSHHKQRFVLVPGSRIVHLRARSSRPQPSLPRQIWNRSERTRAGLLLDMKRPRGNRAGKMLRLIARGLIAPVAALLADHDWKAFLASWLATGRILARCITIFQRGSQCGSKGAHFLDEKSYIDYSGAPNSTGIGKKT